MKANARNIWIAVNRPQWLQIRVCVVRGGAYKYTQVSYCRILKWLREESLSEFRFQIFFSLAPEQRERNSLLQQEIQTWGKTLLTKTSYFLKEVEELKEKLKEQPSTNQELDTKLRAEEERSEQKDEVDEQEEKTKRRTPSISHRFLSCWKRSEASKKSLTRKRGKSQPGKISEPALVWGRRWRRRSWRRLQHPSGLFRTHPHPKSFLKSEYKYKILDSACVVVFCLYCSAVQTDGLLETKYATYQSIWDLLLKNLVSFVFLLNQIQNTDNKHSAVTLHYPDSF